MVMRVVDAATGLQPKGTKATLSADAPGQTAAEFEFELSAGQTVWLPLCRR